MDSKINKIKMLEALKVKFAEKQAQLVQAKALREAASKTGLSTLLEADLNKAEQILAGQDVTKKLGDMVEDLANLSAKDILQLSDEMKETFGPEAAMKFEHASQDAMTNALQAVRQAKDVISTALLVLEGKIPSNDMAADPVDAAPAADMAGDMGSAGSELLGGVDAAPTDDFGGADAASGPVDEPLGRARKESAVSTKSMIKEDFDMALAGRKLLESESMDSLLGWILDEAAAAMPQQEFKSFARKVAGQAAKDPEKTAGWIGKKKYGAAAMAQLAAPTITAGAGPAFEQIAVVEGKTYGRNDHEDDAKAEKFKDREGAKERKAKAKDDEEVNEGKTYGRNDNEDDEKAEKLKDRAANKERKAKSKEDMTEAQKTALAMARIIEANILTKGRGLAADVVKQFSATTLSEGSTQTVMEAFEEMFGMRPAAYSVQLGKQLAEDIPLSTLDQKNKASIVGQVATKMTKDKTMAGKPVSAALQGMNSAERATANKVINQAKNKGTPVNKVSDLMAITGSDDGDKNPNESIEENINAAHWPVDTMGQYKGEPMSTDYQSLKPVSGEHAPKAEAPAKHEASGEQIKDASKFPKKETKKAETPKAESGDKPATSGKPWEKKEAPKAEADDSEEEK